MKPVNLIPADERRNTSIAGRSGGAVYILLGGLAVLVVLLSAYTLAGRTVNEKRSELAETRARADQMQEVADRLATYTSFASLREKRLETVKSLAASRFDWSRALREVSRTVPAGVSLSSLTGTVTSGISIDGAGTGDALRAALPNPALEIAGCAPSQSAVAGLMSSLRRMDSVVRVSLSSTEKQDVAPASTGGGASTGSAAASTAEGCLPAQPKFSMTIFFAMPNAAAAASGSTSATTTTASTTTTSTGATK
jgi:Tfp pilus assembly protein PilN